MLIEIGQTCSYQMTYKFEHVHVYHSFVWKLRPFKFKSKTHRSTRQPWKFSLLKTSSNFTLTLQNKSVICCCNSNKETLLLRLAVEAIAIHVYFFVQYAANVNILCLKLQWHPVKLSSTKVIRSFKSNINIFLCSMSFYSITWTLVLHNCPLPPTEKRNCQSPLPPPSPIQELVDPKNPVWIGAVNNYPLKWRWLA